MTHRKQIISNYIEGYNRFDVSKMVKDFSDDIVFENIQNNEVSLTLHGIEEFRAQAEAATRYFSEREQKIKSFRHDNDRTEVEIAYFGILAEDLPNGMKKGQELNLNGKSVFEFRKDKIIRLTDIS